MSLKFLRYITALLLLPWDMVCFAQNTSSLQEALQCDGFEIDFFGSTTAADDFLSTNEFDFMDGRIRSTDPSNANLTIVLMADQMRLAKLDGEENFLYAERDADYKPTVTNELIEIHITRQGEWHYFFVHVDKASSASIADDKIVSLQVLDKSSGILLFQKDIMVVANQLVLYRGLHDSPSQNQPMRAANARKGIVIPIGWDNDGHCNFAAHVISGENKDIFTSWTLNPHQAIRFIFGYNVGTGLLLKRKFEKDQTIPNEQYFKHLKEHLIIGLIEGASVKILESQKKLSD